MSNYMDDLHTGAYTAPTIDTLEKAAQISPYHMTKAQALLYITSCVENKIAAHLTFYMRKGKHSIQVTRPDDRIVMKDYEPGCLYSPMVLEEYQDVVVVDGIIYALDDGKYCTVEIHADGNDWWFMPKGFCSPNYEQIKKQLEKAAKEW